MGKRLNLIIGLALAILGVLFGNSSVQASETAFYVQPMIPSNQVEETVDYFNIQTSATINQRLQLVITNEASEPKELVLSLLDGMTTRDGSISYNTTHSYDESVRYKVSEFADVIGSIKVAGNSSEVVDVVLDLVTEEFSGVLLGAVNVTEKKEEDTKKGGVANVFAYNIPIKIRVTSQTVTPVLNYQGLEIVNETKGPVINMTMQNPVSEIIRELTLNYQIFKKGQSEVLISEEKSDRQLAPNTLFLPEIELKDQNLAAGEYILRIKATSETINEEWESEFIITRKVAADLNDGFGVSGGKSPLLIWLIVLSGTIIAGGSYYVYRQKKRRKKSKSN